MFVYAGIDEAGYGPMFGPLVVGRAVMAVRDHAISNEPLAEPPEMWELLSRAVCKKLSQRKGRIAVNDSKKLRTAAAGIKHLEMGVLAFAGLKDIHLRAATVDALITGLGESMHTQLQHLPWYHACEKRPWDSLPTCNTDGELAVARSMLGAVAADVGVKMLDMGAAVVFEDRFNKMVAATRSKAATSFTFVGQHLAAIWQKFGQHSPMVVVDRQSGRMRYRELLSLCFPDAQLSVLHEDGERSSYRVEQSSGGKRKSMTVRFEVNGDGNHMPVALASMTAKYTRELFMQRFNNWFGEHYPHIKPTAGYATDGKRFWQEIEPKLGEIKVDANLLKRIS